MITWASHHDGLCLGELAGSIRQGASYVCSYGSSLQASRSLLLAPQESVVQVKTHDTCLQAQGLKKS